MSSQEQVIVDLWDAIDKRIDARFAAKIREFSTNYRPRGNTPVILGAGSVGATITPSTTHPQVHGLLSYPCSFDEIQLEAYPAGTAILDVWVKRPGQTSVAAASIFNGHYPVLDDGASGPSREKTIIVDPADGWITYIEPGSMLYLYVRALTLVETLSLSFTMRCL
jgi:hypothetical protein